MVKRWDRGSCEVAAGTSLVWERRCCGLICGSAESLGLLSNFSFKFSSWFWASFRVFGMTSVGVVL